MSTPPPPPPPPPYGSSPYGSPYGSPQPADQGTPPPGWSGGPYPAGGPYQPPPGYQPYGYSGGPQYASFGARLGAFLIDSLIGALFSIPAVIAVRTGPKKIDVCEINGRDRLCEVPTTAGWIIFGVVLTIGVLAFLVLISRLLGKGQSWGMKVANIRLVGAQDGQPIGFGRAFGRQAFATIISGNVCLLGYLWMLWDRDKQTWHDKIAGSIVVKA